MNSESAFCLASWRSHLEGLLVLSHWLLGEATLGLGLYIGVEGAGFLPSKSIGALAKVGGKKSHHFLPHRLLSPLFRDLDLIPSGYDLIPSKGGSWCALTRGVGPCPHYPRPCGSPHAGGPHSGTF